MNELTNEQQAMSQLYSVLCAVVQSDRTPKVTAEAVVATLQKLFEDENGPFFIHFVGRHDKNTNEINPVYISTSLNPLTHLPEFHMDCRGN